MTSIGNVAVQNPRFSHWVPALTWLRSYQPGWLRGDVAAGVTLAAYLLPAGIGDASLAGLPPQAGIYACLFSGAIFWLFCSSRHTAITVTSAISLLIGASLSEITSGDTTRFSALTTSFAGDTPKAAQMLEELGVEPVQRGRAVVGEHRGDRLVVGERQRCLDRDAP